MLLTDLTAPVTIDTSVHHLMAEFFVPALTASIRYDRGVGYFSSGWLRIAAQGMVQFAANGGRARWVTSPILSEADWEALRMGDQARPAPILRLAMAKNIKELAEALATDTLSAMAWMVADGILDFKLALPTNKLTGGDFHDKFGIFTDAAGQQISFNGSYSESIQGTRNYESIKIFRVWEPAFAPLVQAESQRFERLWNNQDPNVQVYDLPASAREQIVQLRQGERPYPEPEWVKLRRLREVSASYKEAHPYLSEKISLRDYQEQAIKAWFDHACQGLFEMATGTGRTSITLALVTQL